MHLFQKMVACVVFVAALQWAVAQPLGYKAFKLTEDNQPFKINTLYKSSDGYILCGTTNGLYSFDGIRFKKINFSKANIRDTVTAIYEDGNKTLWAGFKNGRLAKKVNDQLEYFEPEEGTPKTAITCFINDKDNNLWFGTNGEGIYYFSNNHLYLIDEENGLSDKFIHALALTANGDILAATDQGINICTTSGNKKTVEVIGTAQDLPDYYVTSIAPAGNNLFWIGLQAKGVCLYSHTTKKIVPVIAEWPYEQVNALLPAQNSVWVAAENGGLVKLYNQKISTGYMPDINLYNLLHDNEGNIWMNNASELVCMAGDKLTLHKFYDQAFFETIHSIVCDYENNVWVSTDAALVKYTRSDKGYVQKRYPIAGLNSKNDITSLYQDVYHNIWIGTMGNGIFVMDPVSGKCRNINENPLLNNASILSITGNGNTVCAAGLEGAAMIFELSGKNTSVNASYDFTNYNNMPNVGNNYIYSIFKDSKGRLWFGTDGKGVTMLQNEKFINYGEKDGLRDEHISSFTEDLNGHIWFSTENAGIYKFDGRRFVNYSAAQGLSDLKITALKTDRRGNIIIVHKKGIDILNTQTGNVAYMNNTQGIPSVNTDPGAVTLDTAGNILLSTETGIVVCNTNNLVQSQPKTLIEVVQLFSNVIDKSVPGKFSYDENGITFSFAGLYYTCPENVRYQYKLDGLDTSWIETRDRTIPFPNLQPGHYTFHIRSSLSENFENADEAVYTFTIAVPLWKRWWFIGLCIVVAAAGIYWYMKYREREIKKMQLLQQEKIQFQFEVLRNQVNPHFLFNSFNTLISIIEENPKMGVDYVEHLSDFFRNIVNYRDKDIISLAEELELLQTYFYLQQKRYGQHLALNHDIQAVDKKHLFIPPLTLQLLAENAIKHNAVSKETPLKIELFIDNKGWLIIKNNINERISKQPGAGMGLQNIISRYKLLSKEPVSVSNDGHNFIVSLPPLKQA